MDYVAGCVEWRWGWRCAAEKGTAVAVGVALRLEGVVCRGGVSGVD